MDSKNTGLNQINESENSEFPFLMDVIKSGGRNKLRNKINLIKVNFLKNSKKPESKSGVIKEFKIKVEKLFDLYFTPYENLLTVRSEKEKDKLLQEAMGLYSLKNYSGAVKLLKNHLAKNPGDPLSQFYLGISLLASGEYNYASSIFKKLIKKKNPLISDHAIWYLALTNLKDHKLQEAVIVLNEIGERNYYSRKAGNLKKKISSILK